MKVSIIIPNYNGEEIMRKNLPKVLEALVYFGDESEIIIPDDNSNDNSINIINDFIEKNKSSKVKIKLVLSKVNKGFSSNVNKGVNASSGEILILLNSDVVPSYDFINPLLDYFKDDKVFAVGCMDESVENEKVVLRGRGKGSWKRGFLMHSAADINDENNKTLWVSGGSGAFRKEIWDKLGGLDEIYNPFYWEDIDLSYRALKKGYKIYFEKKSVVRHEHEKGVIKKKFKKNKVNEIVYRNQFIFAWKNSDLSNLLIGVIWLPVHLINALFSKDLGLLKGFLFALAKLPNILKFRFSSNKKFIFSDKEIIENISS